MSYVLVPATASGGGKMKNTTELMILDILTGKTGRADYRVDGFTPTCSYR